MDLNSLLAVSKSDLVSGLRIERLHELLESSTVATFGAGDLVLAEGDKPDAAYVVIDGHVQIFCRDPESDEVVVLAKLGESDFFGEQAFLAPAGRRSASARASSACRLLKIPGDAVESILLVQEQTRQLLTAAGVEHAQNRFLHLSRVLRLLLGSDGASTKPGERRFVDGQAVFYEGDPPDGLHVILSGQARVVHEVDGQLVQLAQMSPGQVFGDYALVEGTTRTASVLASGELRTLFVGRERFLELFRTDPRVEVYVRTLTRMYELPKSGFVSQHIGLFEGGECFYTVYDLIDRRQVSVMRTGDGERCRVAVVQSAGQPAATPRRVTFESPGTRVVIGCSDGGEIVEADVTGPWPELPGLVQAVLDDRRLEREVIERFESEGRIRLELGILVSGGEGDSDTCCNCMQVSFGAVKGAIAGGAHRLNLLAAQLGCGSVCGGCVPVILNLLGETGWYPVEVVDVVRHTTRVRSFCLQPKTRLPGDFQPGQHIVVRSKIDGRWVRRPYTLTSISSDEAFEITVKREEHGVFSNWLFEADHEAAEIQVSPPQGDYCWQADGRPVVCVVAGIGLTPAIAILRQMRAEGLSNALHIDCSVHELAELAFRGELEHSATSANITLRIRETGACGRIAGVELEALSWQYPEADFFICGPGDFNADVRNGLESAEVRPERIHVEEFVQQGDAPTDAPRPNQQRESRSASALKRQSPLSPCPQRRRWHPVEVGKSALSRLIDLGNSRLVDWRFGSVQLNPFRAVSDRVVEKYSKIDPRVPRERLGFLSFVLKRGSRQNLDGFRRFRTDTFAYVIPRTPLKQFEGEDAVNTGFTEFSANRLIPVYVTRDRKVMAQVLGDLESFDKGALPNHYFAQLVGASTIEPTAETFPAGVVAGRIANNTTWDEDRRLVHDHVMEELESHVEELHDELLDVVEEMQATLREAEGRTWDGVALMMAIVFRLLLRTLFGFPSREAADVRGELIERVESGVKDVVRATNSLPIDDAEFTANVTRIRSLLARLCERIDDGSAAGGSAAGRRRSHLTRYLLESRESGEDGMREVAKVLVPMVVGGTNTSVISVIWGLYWIVMREDIRERYLAEVRLFRLAQGERPLTPAAYAKRPFTLMLYNEVLRYHTPTDVIARSALKNCMLQATDGQTIAVPKDALVVCSLHGCHHDDKVFTDPGSFRPSRFGLGITPEMSVEERGRKVLENSRELEGDLSLVPFGAGRGRCPGRSLNMLEFFLVLDSLLTHFDVRLDASASDLTPHSASGIGDFPSVLGLRIEERPRPL